MKLYPSPAHTVIRRIVLATDLYRFIKAARQAHREGVPPDHETIYTQAQIYTDRVLDPHQRAELTRMILDPDQDPATLMPDPDPTVTHDHLEQLYQDPDLPGLYLNADWSITTDPTGARPIVHARDHHEREHGGHYSSEELLTLYNQRVQLLTRSAYNQDHGGQGRPPARS